MKLPSHGKQLRTVSGGKAHRVLFDTPEVISDLSLSRARGEQTVDASNVGIVFVLRCWLVQHPDWIPVTKQYESNALLNFSRAGFGVFHFLLSAERSGSAAARSAARCNLLLGLMPPPDCFQDISDANGFRLVHCHTKVLPYLGPNLKDTLVVAEITNR